MDKVVHAFVLLSTTESFTFRTLVKTVLRFTSDFFLKTKEDTGEGGRHGLRACWRHHLPPGLQLKPLRPAQVSLNVNVTHRITFRLKIDKEHGSVLNREALFTVVG